MAEGRCKRGRLSLLAVQSIACGVVLLLALVLRLIGGSTWDRLRTVFRQWLTDGGVAEQWADRWEETDRQQPVSLPADVSTAAPTAPAVAAVPLAEGRLTSAFGYRSHPVHGGTGFHRGVDIAAAAKSPLYAVYDGTVSAAGWSDSYGYRIVVSSADGWEVGYAHCSALLYRVGDSVHAGDCVARVGSTGNATGDHVHLTVTHNGLFYDPALLLPDGYYA